MIIVFVAVLGIIMIAAALLAVHQKRLLSAVILAGVISLLASVMYIVLASPDVAMTEAAIGSALTTIVFLFTLKKIREQDRYD